ncbi:MAG: hypothetical protein WBG19_06765 [Thermoplasmata archaeon]
MFDPGPKVDASRRISRTIEILRIGVGVVWAVNLLFIVDPANQYFGNFAETARSFAPTTLGGPALANFVASNAVIFSWIVALLTAYLAVAFLLGLTTRLACLFGGIFSALLLGTQVGSTFVFPGGTDVGEHPLYLLIYMVLVFGGAGQALSADQWIALAIARFRASLSSRPRPTPSGFWAGSVNLRMFAVYFVVGIVLAFGIGAGLVVSLPSNTGSTTPGPIVPAYENLTVSINSVNGWPQYSPANFTLPTGEVIFTITDEDMPMNWSGCGCVVTGTPGDIEYINGTPAHVVNASDVAHTFNVPALGLSIYSPGMTVVRFTVLLLSAGKVSWFCMAPCGAGTNPYTSPPMGVKGYMAGTITIT